MQPSRITMSQSFFSGVETLTPQSTIPVDRETGASLAEIIFPQDCLNEMPILEPNLGSAINSIIDEWRHQDLLREAGVHPTTTCLLYGPPGTGKTQIALNLGTLLNMPVVLARLDGVISSFLGTTGRNVANLFSFANRYSCILLLDEFDAIAKLRDDPHEIGEIKRVVNTLLQNIDQRKGQGFTIATTNHEQLLDSAVWRRFDVRIAIGLPSFSERLKIVARYFGEIGISTEYTQFVAWLCEGMSGGDIESLARQIKRYRALNSEATYFDALRNYAITQTGGTFRHKQLLFRSYPEIARQINTSTEIQLTQKEIGSLLSVSQSQIGRWIKEDAHK